MIYWIGYCFWKFLGIFFYPITLHGAENIPRLGAYIFASNHLSNMDPMLIGLCVRCRLSYFAKDTLFKNKFLSFILFQVGAFPVKRHSADIGAVREALARLKSGCPLVVFPEGSRHIEKKEIQSGIAFIAVKSGVPVIPVFIKGSDKLMGTGTKFLKRQSISIYFGHPRIYTQNEAYPDIAQSIMADINALGAEAK